MIAFSLCQTQIVCLPAPDTSFHRKLARLAQHWISDPRVVGLIPRLGMKFFCFFLSYGHLSVMDQVGVRHLQRNWWLLDRYPESPVRWTDLRCWYQYKETISTQELNRCSKKTPWLYWQRSKLLGKKRLVSLTW